MEENNTLLIFSCSCYCSSCSATCNDPYALSLKQSPVYVFVSSHSIRYSFTSLVLEEIICILWSVVVWGREAAISNFP
ncbi:hypothetical protein VNO80_18367 [Phaseolus coccineus]|uniref:Uncharacterized protein n=1 Tax=Phaseolus coccineus TaxID=3886 RepID=A0AAN9MEA2_PHACN